MFPQKPINTDIYAGIKPLYCAAQLVGLAPYAYVRSEQTGEESLDISRGRNVKKIIWGLLLLGVQFIGILCKLAESITTPPDTLTDLVNDLLQILFFGATSIGALTFALTVNREKMLQFINTLCAVDRFLLRDNKVYKKQNIILLTRVICATTTSIIIYYFDVYYYISFNILYVITIYLPDYIWIINELQFVNFVETLRVRLTIFNSSIPMFVVQENDANSRRRPGRYARTHVTQSRIRVQLLCRYMRDEFKCGPAQTWSHNCDVTYDMLRLSEIYNRLYEMFRLINSMYGYMLLQEFTSYTVCLTVDGYNLLAFLVSLYKGENPVIRAGGCPSLILWNTSNFIRLFLICLACQRVNNEVRRTANRIETLKLRRDLSAEVSNQLRMFAKQVEQCKIEFSACGFFHINLSHFCCVVLTATTYITMLVFLER
jgi:hypothetical protein